MDDNFFQLNIGGSVTLNATNNGAPDNNVLWSVVNAQYYSDPTVVSLSTVGPLATCVVTALKTGTAVVSFTDGACAGAVTIKVTTQQQSCAGLKVKAL